MKRIDRRKLISLLILAAFFIGGYLLSSWLESKRPADAVTDDSSLETAVTDTAEDSAQEDEADPAAPPADGSEDTDGSAAEDGANSDAASAEDTDSEAGQEDTDADGGESATQETEEDDALPAIDEDGSYTTKEDVALYLITYGRLPDNFITKAEARDLGWTGGGLEDHAPGCCIGGDKFGNREGLLPSAPGRQYYECDIDTLGRDSRGAKRIVYSNDGYIYYTDDHYESFTFVYRPE